MLIVYDTMTGNTRKFVHKLPYECCHISEYDGISPFILVTYTINFGQIPTNTEEFLKVHHNKMIAVSSSGNKNWGGYYGISANKIATKYNVPIISKFELQGTNKDISHFIERVDEVVKMDRTKQHG